MSILCLESLSLSSKPPLLKTLNRELTRMSKEPCIKVRFMQVLNADTHPKTIDFQTERFVRLNDFDDIDIVKDMKK